MASDADRVVICQPLRTPVGRAQGALCTVPVEKLAATVIGEIVDRTGVDTERIDEVILGQCYPNGEAPALGRVAALDAGLPVTVTGTQIDRRCGSGLQAILNAVLQVQARASAVVIAGGAESMSRVEHYSVAIRSGVRAGGVELMDRLARARVTAGGAAHPVPGGMVETAENLRREFSITREAQDQLAFQSQARAIAAIDEGRFDRELVPVAANDHVVDSDEHPRRGVTLERLASLTPVMARSDPEATVTAGNASGQNDGASACLVTTESLADQLGVRPWATVRGWACRGVEPHRMGIGVVPAVHEALSRSGLSLGDMDLIEINEAFAAQVLACTAALDLSGPDFDRINVNGSGISLGHPLGATGARIVTTLLHELEHREARFGLVSMCIGGGQGLAAVVERL